MASNYVFAEASQLPLARYRLALGKEYSEPLAMLCALCEALQERVSPFALSARQASEFLYGDREKFHAAGGLIKCLEETGFIKKSVPADPDNHQAAKYVITSFALGRLQ